MIQKKKSKKSIKEPKKLPKVKSHQECVNLINMAELMRDRIVLDVIYYCGLRVTEAISLRRKDIDMEKRCLYVIQGKGSKDRNVPIPKPLFWDLQMFFNFNEFEPKDKLFPMSRVTVHNLIKRLDKSFHAHTLRHSYATHVYEVTGKIYLVQRLLGHTNPSATQIYVDISNKAKLEEVDKVY